MGRKNKLKKFADLFEFSNVYESFEAKNPGITAKDGSTIDMKGKWRSDHFKNDHPLVLELACGRGEYSVQMARRDPKTNFIGVDIKGARIWKGAKIALEEKLDNVAFLRTRIEMIEYFFAADEIDEIWITFPDPFLRKSKANRRLTAPMFLDRYRKILKPGGFVHLKTDAPSLHEFTLETIQDDEKCIIDYQNDDIYSGPLENELLAFKTYYEYMHLEAEKTIKYIRFSIH